MKHELWYSEGARSGVLVDASHAEAARQRWPGARVSWVIDTDAYERAAQICEMLLRWGNDAARTGTVRVTQAFYSNQQGEQRSLSVPGWVGRIPALVPGTEDLYLGFLDHFEPVRPADCVRLLGHVFVERSGRIVADGGSLAIQATLPFDLTIARLRSVVGTEMMWQEFDGLLQDEHEILNLLRSRLGPEMANWTVLDASVLRRDPTSH